MQLGWLIDTYFCFRLFLWFFFYLDILHLELQHIHYALQDTLGKKLNLFQVEMKRTSKKKKVIGGCERAREKNYHVGGREREGLKRVEHSLLTFYIVLFFQNEVSKRIDHQTWGRIKKAFFLLWCRLITTT